jgi:rSAM/selenodomain-associated transferase 2
VNSPHHRDDYALSQLSVIVPALNEAEHIDRVLDHALAPASIRPEQILVVDGGSSDGTPDLARRRVPVLECARGRAHQMNAGALWSTGEWLLFCHADTLLPPNYPYAIQGALKDRLVVGGGFSPRYQPASPWLNLTELLLRLPTSKLLFGDSGLFVRRTVFEAVGGFPEVPLMEELELVGALAAHGRLLRLPEQVITSSRRFMERGVLRQLLSDIRLLIDFHLLGRNPEELAPRYWRTARDRLD